MNIHKRSAAEDLFGVAWTLILMCWAIAGLSVIGALALSEMLQIVPCVICWYLRVFMFPLVPVLMVGIILYDRNVVYYALPLGGIGWLVAVAHLVLITGAAPGEAASCARITTCTETQIMWSGFAAIPLLWVAAFSIVNVLLLAAHFKHPSDCTHDA
ncbi:disulfide bond formation protein B [Aromatoleum evansii]|uniref:disulfide bond formation protein B n=1 Tax=Aromatoleum evansii TaxID=59406 RepID=UPI00145DD515|nr:disulfide bond formation protein B [Aromatoleum evansii]NMG32203.1 disulfide bond formation protein B [Aromatoleum evansii]